MYKGSMVITRCVQYPSPRPPVRRTYATSAHASAIGLEKKEKTLSSPCTPPPPSPRVVSGTDVAPPPHVSVDAASPPRVISTVDGTPPTVSAAVATTPCAVSSVVAGTPPHTSPPAT
ncbi:hypothetical protein ZWY2020_038177 [Hordeum vulgare]|nr:hypothetical protein ZWY2020_038177 [Hordeum vulgare]